MRTEQVDIVTNRHVTNGPVMSWGAIFAGVFVAFITNIIFMSLGSAIGFTSFDPSAGDSVGRGTFLAASIFTLISAVVSVFAGGYVAARMSGHLERRLAGLHGLCTWAVVSTFSVFLIAMGVGNLAGAAFGIVGQGFKGLTQAGVEAVKQSGISGQDIATTAKNILRDTGKPELAPENLQREAQETANDAAQVQAQQGGEAGAQVVENRGEALMNEVDQDAVASVLARRMNISEAEAKSLVGQSDEKAREVLGTIQQEARTTGLAAAEKATDTMAVASWISFVLLVIGAIAGYFGGVTGGQGVLMVDKRRVVPNQNRVNTGKPLEV